MEWGRPALPEAAGGWSAGRCSRCGFAVAAGPVRAALAATSRAYGFDHPRFRWSRQLDSAQIQQALSRAALPLGLPPTRLAVLERGPSGRVLALEIQAQAASGVRQSVVLRRDAIRRTLRQLPSTLFMLRPDGPDRWIFEGEGLATVPACLKLELST